MVTNPSAPAQVSTMTGGVDAGAGDDRLAKGNVSLTEVLFVSIAAMGPASGAAYAITSGSGFAGGSLPLGVLIALVGCLLVAVAIGQLAKHMATAGGLASYVGKAIHSGIGFVTAWVYPFVYICAGPYLCLVFGNLIASTIFPKAEGPGYTLTWIVATAVCMAVAFTLNYFGVKFGTNVVVILGIFEIAVFVILAIVLIVAAGPNNTLQVFTPADADANGFHGMSGVVAGSIYGFLAFIGFEAAAPLAAETKRPRRNIPRAIIGATLLVGVFYVLTTYAITVYFGPEKMVDFLSFQGGNGWLAISQKLWGLGWIVVLIALMNSCLACATGGGMAASRSVWAMAHHRTIPHVFARTNPRTKSPTRAVFLVFGIEAVLTIVVAGILGPVEGYVMFGEVLTIAILPIYLIAAIACPIYFLRFQRKDFRVWLHVVIPVAGVLFLIPAFFAGAGIPVFSWIAPLTFPLNLAGPIVAVWYLVGAGVAMYLWRRRRESLVGLATDGDHEDSALVTQS
ncbi:APC family permease [Microbacterium rhizosphaerae]|uniref:APC family permease n=1 Tax=Microbacterium rhizosphaerae TaxID=1678237 RepID=A0ABZ0SPB9_9MICO|nr:APC family permease [Microbacterium rhizosphaerae]WPR89673.1 APC family permease [Microbacterium rhizosphaerae]